MTHTRAQRLESMDNRHIRVPEPLRLDGNVAENWRVFKQNFDIYAIAIELNKKSEPVLFF